MVTSWPKDRPSKPDIDPLYSEIVRLIRDDNRSRYAKACVSGLSPSTLKNWEDGKVRRPQGVSLQMAAQMLGYNIELVKK